MEEKHGGMEKKETSGVRTGSKDEMERERTMNRKGGVHPPDSKGLGHVYRGGPTAAPGESIEVIKIKLGEVNCPKTESWIINPVKKKEFP